MRERAAIPTREDLYCHQVGRVGRVNEHAIKGSAFMNMSGSKHLERERERESEGSAQPGVMSPTWALLRLALPLAIQALFTRTLMVQDLILIGHFLGRDAVAATALGSTLYQMFYYFLAGMATAVDTMCSQSHGAGSHVDTVRWAQRGMLMLLVSCIPVILVLGFGANFLFVTVMRQDADVSEMAAYYVRILLPGLPAQLAFDVLVKFLQSQTIMMPFLYVSLAINFVNIGLDVLLLSTLGFEGAPIATTLCRYLSLALLMIYIGCARLHERNGEFPGWTWTHIADRASLARLWAMGLAGGVMLTAEAFSFEITTVFAGQLGSKVILDAHFIALSYIGAVYSVLPSSVSVASSICCGNLVGEQSHVQARRTAIHGILLGGASMLLSAGVIFFDRRIVGRIYSSDNEIIRVVSSLALITSVFQVFDGFQSGAVGAMRGLGKQNVAALITGVGFSAIGISSGYVFCFVAEYGLFGLWMGLCVGIMSTALISVVVLLCFTDFEKITAVDSTQEGNAMHNGHTKEHASYALLRPEMSNGGVYSFACDNDYEGDGDGDGEADVDGSDADKLLVY